MICDALRSTTLLVKISSKYDRIWESYGHKTIQRQPAKVVFADSKIFEHSYLGNHKFYTNETYHNYGSPRDLSFGKKSRRHSLSVTLLK